MGPVAGLEFFQDSIWHFRSISITWCLFQRGRENPDDTGPIFCHAELGLSIIYHLASLSLQFLPTLPSLFPTLQEIRTLAAPN